METADRKPYENVKVYVRQGPFRKHSKQTSIVQKIDNTEIQFKSGYRERKFFFEKVFNEKATQLDVFNTVALPMVHHVLSGYNCTILAYGQSGTGKSHTIFGENLDNSVTGWRKNLGGVMPKATMKLFSELNSYSPMEYIVRISFIEICNEEVRDLLDKNSPTVRICDEPGSEGIVFMRGMSVITVNSTNDVFSWLTKGMANLLGGQQAQTIFSFLITSTNRDDKRLELMKSAKLQFVDMASSDIAVANKSLHVLHRVITALVHKEMHIPYKDSKLTRILEDSFGGNTKTSVIATFSASSQSWDETIRTLECAQMMRAVGNNPQINFNRNKALFIKDIEDEVSRLQRELQAARKGDGFYMCREDYESMTEELKNKDAKVLELIGRIKDLNHLKISKDLEHERLSEDLRRKQDISQDLNKELREVTAKVHQDELMLTHIKQKDDEMTKTAKLLLDVYQTSSKRCSIYLKKYEEQRNATMRNADVAKKGAENAQSYLSEMQRATNSYFKDSASPLNEIAESAKNLRRQLQGSEAKAQFSFKVSSIKFTPGDWFQNSTDHRAIIHKTFDDAVVQIESETSEAEKQWRVLRECRENRLNAQQSLFTDCITTTSIIKDKPSCVEEMSTINLHKSTELDTLTVSDSVDSISALGIACSTIVRDDKKAHKKIGDISKEIREEMNAKDVKYVLEDTIEAICASEKGKTCAVDNILHTFNDGASVIQSQIELNENRNNQYLATCNESLEIALENVNDEKKSTLESLLNIANSMKQDSIENCIKLEAGVNIALDSTSKLENIIKTCVQETTEELTSLEQNLAIAHAGDTPARCSYVYPTLNGRHLGADLSTQLKDILED